MSLFSPIDFSPKTDTEGRIRMSLSLIAPALAALQDRFQSAIAALVQPQKYREGYFTVTLTGVTATITGTALFIVHGKTVSLYLPTLSGTSNTTDLTLTGLPSFLWPVRTQKHLGSQATDNTTDFYQPRYSVLVTGVISVAIKKTINGAFTFTGFTAANTKAVDECAIDYNQI